jgi:NADH:ubiquinone reductase (H+-translocating)
MSGHRVVVVGAGFGGLAVAKSLRREPVSITMVDRRNFHLFQPLLYQVATAALNPSDIAYPIRTIFRRQRNVERIVLGEVIGVDPATRTIDLADGEKLPYDTLVLATGATHSYFGHDDWRQTAPGLKTIEDALTIRRRILEAFERAEHHPENSQKELTFVVVGAGPTGVELAGALAEIATRSLVDEYHRIDPASARVILVEGGPRVLPVYPARLSASAREQLESLGVEVSVDTAVSAVDGSGVVLADGSRIDAGTVLWAAGVTASPLGAMLGAETDRTGRVRVGPDLSITGHPEVFVIGDLAAIEGVPGVAPAALQQGRHAGRQIANDVAGRPRLPFRYRDKGNLATIGRARAVADLGVIRFSGFAAWGAWLTIHIAYLIGFRNRLLVLISWAWNYLTFRRGARIITGTTDRTPNL